MNLSSGNKKRTVIRDPVHNFIDLSYYDFILKIVDTPYFQRTRRLSHLGVSLFVYPSATHSRFNHSLGAMEVFVRLFDHLQKDEKRNNLYHKLRKTGIAAVLLHDIGHGPFSHASEKPLAFKHDLMSEEIVKTNEIREILEKAEISVNDVLSVISRRATGKIRLLSQLINSELDVDRLDYLARDIYFTGVGFGGVDLERIIKTLTISQSNDFLRGYAVVEEKGKDAIEAYLLTRTLMYDNVYYHKTTRSVECLLGKIFTRVRDLYNEGRLTIPYELKFIERLGPGSDKRLSPEDILLLDDHSLYALLLKWSKNDDDGILTDLSKRVIERKLLKSFPYESEKTELFLEKRKQVEKLVYDKLHLDPKYYCIIDEPVRRPYKPVKSPTDNEEIEESLKNNIYVREDRGGLKEISETSDVIQALIRRKPINRIYFPEEIRNDVYEIFKND